MFTFLSARRRCMRRASGQSRCGNCSGPTIGGAILRFRSSRCSRPLTHTSRILPSRMPMLSLRHPSSATVAGFSRAIVGAVAPFGAPLGDVYATGRGTRGFGTDLELNGRTMQDIRGERPRVNSIGAGVGRGGLTPQE